MKQDFKKFSDNYCKSRKSVSLPKSFIKNEVYIEEKEKK
jgi:hypothetical protein